MEQKKIEKQTLPRKTRKLVKVLTENPTMTLTKAGEIAGYKHRQSAHRALTKADKTFMEKMDEAGLTEEFLLEKTMQGLTASHETEKLQKSEDGTEENKVLVQTPDHTVRHRYLETSWKLRGRLREGNTVNNNTLVIQDRNGTIENIKRAIGKNKAH